MLFSLIFAITKFAVINVAQGQHKPLMTVRYHPYAIWYLYQL